MDINSDRLALWPGYFDSRLSRSEGRRVGVDYSVPKPDLEGLAWAARQVGLKKIKREAGVSHPKRPYGKEGRLWISSKSADSEIGTGKKEEIMQLIGLNWKQLYLERKQEEAAVKSAGPKVGDKRGKSQRKRSSAAQQASKRAQRHRQQRSRKKSKR